MLNTKYHYNKSFFSDPVESNDFYFYQLGELYSSESTVFGDHIQQCDEISLILAGKGYFYTDREKHPVQKGDCYFCYKDRLHGIESCAGEPLRFFFCGFEPKSPRAKNTVTALKALGQPCIFCNEAENIFSELINETVFTDKFSTDMLDAQLLRLLITALRKARNEQSREKPTLTSGLVYQMTLYLKSHLKEPDALSNLEREFHYNYRYLYTCFLQSMGEPPRRYFLKMRMEYAKQQLSGGATVTEVADDLGYSTVHPFSRAYKNHFGTPPTDIIKAGKGS